MPSPENIVRGLAFWRGLRSVVPLAGGVSNAAFIVDDDAGRHVARIGQDYPFHQVSRQREVEAHRAAHACGLSPALEFAQPGVMVVAHVQAKTLGEADVRGDWQLCLELVARCHRDMGRHIRGQGAIFWVFQILRDYAEILRRAQHAQSGNLVRWMAIVDAMEAAQVPMPIVFGHHDLLPTNLLDDGARLWLIDWEYGAFGTAFFDLANLAAASQFDGALEGAMLEAYVGRKPDGGTVRAYHAMKVMAALREAMWGMVSELHLAAPGVDYVAYAAEYISRFEGIYAQYNKDFQ